MTGYGAVLPAVLLLIASATAVAEAVAPTARALRRATARLPKGSR